MTISFDPYRGPNFREALEKLGFDLTKPITYGCIYRVADEAWQPLEPVKVQCPHVVASFLPSGGWVPYVDRRGELRVNTVEYPSLLVAVYPDTADLDKIVSEWRPLADVIAGLISLHIGGFQLQERLWSGFLAPSDKPERIRVFSGRTFVATGNLSKSRLEELNTLVAHLDIANVPTQLALALRWYARAAVESEVVDRFIGYWLSCRVVVRTWHANTIEGDPSDIDAFEEFGRTRMGLDNRKLEAFMKDIRAVYSVRNRLFKGSRMDVVTDEVILKIKGLADWIVSLESRDWLPGPASRKK